MSDTYRRYGAIKQAIMQFYTPHPSGHREKHFNTLVALICPFCGGRHAHLPTIADHAPVAKAQQESVIKRFRRWLDHDAHTIDGWFSPVAKSLLAGLASQELVLVMDGSVVGRGCLALMVSCVYHGRALPLCWVVVAAPKGHFPQDTHRALLTQVAQLVPAGARVLFLGDGEFDGTFLQADLEQRNWQYVCRTASNSLVYACDNEFHLADVPLLPGEYLALSAARITAKRYGPASLLLLWDEQFDTPLYLVTNMSDLEQAVARYKLRAHIETFFSDQKSRGFHLDASHISTPERLARLLIASCLAYIWLIYLSVCALKDDWMRRLHRTDRCDLSLFRLGLRLLARCLTESHALPEGLLLPPVLPTALVRSFHKQPV